MPLDPAPPALSPTWRWLHWATLGLAVLAGLILLPSSSHFGTSGYGGYGQIAVMLLALAGSAATALAGLVVTAVTVLRGARRPLLLAGVALDVAVLAGLVLILVELA